MVNVWQENQHTQWREDSLFNKWCWGKNDTQMKKNKTGPLFNITQKTCKKTKDLNAKPETKEENQEKAHWP